MRVSEGIIPFLFCFITLLFVWFWFVSHKAILRGVSWTCPHHYLWCLWYNMGFHHWTSSRFKQGKSHTLWPLYDFLTVWSAYYLWCHRVMSCGELCAPEMQCKVCNKHPLFCFERVIIRVSCICGVSCMCIWEVVWVLCHVKCVSVP